MFDANFKIVLFGDETKGKRILTHNYMINLFSKSQVDSLGVDFEVKSLSVDNYKIKLQIWDISGERRFREFLPTYISHARGGLFVYDVTEKSSLTNIDFWLNLVKKELTKEDDFPIIAVGIVPESVNQRQITSEDGKILAELHNLDGIFECSFRSESKIEKMFETISKLILERSPPASEPSITKSPLGAKGSLLKEKKKSKKNRRARNLKE